MDHGRTAEIIFIIDRSGSMEDIKNDAIGGFNAFMREQKNVPGKARVTFVQFDHDYELLYSSLPLTEVHDLTPVTFVPRGWTALLDAVGRTLTEQYSRINSFTGFRPDEVIVVILTDGKENRSHQYDRARVRQLICDMQNKGWSFVYLGANQDAFAEAQAMGIDHMHPKNFVDNWTATAAGTATAYGVTGQTVSNLRNTGKAK